MNLEKYINDRKDDFDNEVPDLKVWAEIDKNLSQKKESKRVSFFRFRNIAAACLLLLTGGIAGFYFSGNTVQNKAPIAVQIDPEFREVESFYRDQYNEKVAQLASYQLEDEFSDDLRQFEEIMGDLNIELSNVPKGKRERLITTIINNYQNKIEILERVLEQLQSIDTSKINTTQNEINI